MSRSAIPTWFFVLVVVRKGDRFLVVHERKHGQLWYLPAGRVEPGESFAAAAQRETLEEAGIPIHLEGVARIEHSPRPDGSRLRVIFVARPADDTAPKTIPDDESLEARWVTLEELAALPQRGAEMIRLFHDIARGAPLYPMDLIGTEGQPLLP
ncbi:MAG TPA: NUDIX domain-containing protein [Kofleriaceae bacterium]|nr:NUDIX domain-containing protein [Kofleriaceae bacterium]